MSDSCVFFRRCTCVGSRADRGERYGRAGRRRAKTDRSSNRPTPGADVLIDGTRKTLDDKWTYWEGPRFSSSLPIKWKLVDDPVDQGSVLVSSDPAGAGGKYGAADIVTKKKYRDFRLHIEFLVPHKGGNSGVYLQNRYEIQILDGDRGNHGMAAVINEAAGPYHVYRGTGKWNAYDIVFRAARFKDGKLTEKALVTIYFNGVKGHTNQRIEKVWGGPNSGLEAVTRAAQGLPTSPEDSSSSAKDMTSCIATRGSSNSTWKNRIRI